MPNSARALGHEGLRLRSRRVRSGKSHRLSGRFALAMIVVAGLVGATGATVRTRSAPALAAPASEQRYLQEFVPIHARVERNVQLMGLLAAGYDADDIDQAQLTTRLSELLESYRQAAEQARSLDPPASLRSAHQDYLYALRLLEQATVEMLAAYGDDSAVVKAVPLSLNATTLLHAVTDQYWPQRARR